VEFGDHDGFRHGCRWFISGPARDQVELGGKIAGSMLKDCKKNHQLAPL
jgi:hypothetical protein